MSSCYGLKEQGAEKSKAKFIVQAEQQVHSKTVNLQGLVLLYYILKCWPYCIKVAMNSPDTDKLRRDMSYTVLMPGLQLQKRCPAGHLRYEDPGYKTHYQKAVIITWSLYHVTSNSSHDVAVPTNSLSFALRGSTLLPLVAVP